MKIYPEYVTKDRVMQPGQEGSAVDVGDFYWKGNRILGQIYVPVHTPGEKHPLAITLHGFPGYTNNQDIDHALRRCGFVTLHYFAPGAWGSEGFYTFDGLIDCAMAALDLVKTDEFAEKYSIDRDNIFFVGHSMGGMTSINVLRRREDIKGGVFLAPFDVAQFYCEGNDPDDLRPLFEEACILHTDGPFMETLLQNAKDTSGDLLFIDAAEALKDRNILFVGGAKDPLAPPATMCEPLFNKIRELNTKPAKQEYVLLDSDHGFNDMRIKLCTIIAEYLADLVE